MSYPIILTIFFFSLYFGYGLLISEYKKELRTILYDVFIAVSLCIWVIYIIMFLGEYQKMSNLFYFIFIAITGFTMYKIYTLSLKKPLEIVAKQQSYWGVKAKDIYKKYDWKLDFKKDRIEIKNNPLEKKIYRQYSNNVKYITGNIFLAMEDLELTYVNSISDINSNLYKTILSKIENIIKENEIKANLDNLLKENDNCVEFFLINCWELFTTKVNIGIATLDVLVTNFTEYELLGALDNATLSNVKRHGSAMYFKYMKFKNLLPKLENEDKKLTQTEEDDDFF